jgi:hypothetical protein
MDTLHAVAETTERRTCQAFHGLKFENLLQYANISRILLQTVFIINFYLFRKYIHLH